jgi:hypothetical protein
MDFSKVEAEFEKLKGQFAAGALTEAEFKARLQELMLQDEQGDWWMVGYETGEWYRHDGTNWVRDDPRSRLVIRGAPQPEVPPVAPTKPKLQWFLAIVLLGLAITSVLGFWVGQWTYVFSHGETESLICASAVWLGGLILTIVITRRVARPKR